MAFSKPLFALCLAAVLSSIPSTVASEYSLIMEYSGTGFFNTWDFYGNYDNLTNGDVNYLNESAAMSQQLTYVNSANNAILKVDNTSTVVYNDKRNSVRIQSQETFDIGTVLVMDAVHLPYGCSVWPSFWTSGVVNWPDTGEMDIIEYVNDMSDNQYALHTAAGCNKGTDPTQVGTSLVTNCNATAGCTVGETKASSNGAAFASAGGGVYATQFDVSGIYMWFWSRNDIPASISAASTSSPLNISDFGAPSASYPASSCNISQYFGAQQLVLDITLCGDWADGIDIYNASGLCTGTCYLDNVVGNGSVYDEAYFEISYIRAFSTSSANASSSASGAASSATPGSSSTTTGSSGSNDAVTRISSGVIGMVALLFSVAMLSLHL